MRMMTSRMTLGSLLHSFMPLMLGITWRCLAAWCRCWHNSEARSSSAIQFSTLRANRMGSYCGTRSEETTVSYRPLSDTTLALYPCCCARFNLKPRCHQRCRVSSWSRGSRKSSAVAIWSKWPETFFFSSQNYQTKECSTDFKLQIDALAFVFKAETHARMFWLSKINPYSEVQVKLSYIARYREWLAIN